MHTRDESVPSIKAFSDWLYKIAQAASTVVTPFSHRTSSVNTHDRCAASLSQVSTAQQQTNPKQCEQFKSCRILLFAQCRCRLVNEHPREGNNQQCCLRSRHNKNKTEIQTRTTAISRRIFLEHLDWTTQLLLWSWSPSQHPLDTSPNPGRWIMLPRLSYLTPQHEFLLTRLHFVFTL